MPTAHTFWAGTPTRTAHAASVEARVGAHNVPGNPWQAIYLDTGVRRAVVCAAAEVVCGMNALVGRRAVAGDLAPLGGATLPVLPGSVVTQDAYLEDVVLAVT